MENTSEEKALETTITETEPLAESAELVVSNESQRVEEVIETPSVPMVLERPPAPARKTPRSNQPKFSLLR